jgi:hypothetical protein
MLIRLDPARRVLPVLLGAVTLASVAVLLVWDGFPGLFPAMAHDFLAAFSLAAIALAYLACQILRRPAGMELAKSILLAMAFLFWAANQFWPNLRPAMLFSDIAIALFVLDAYLVIAGWPQASPASSVARADAEPGKDRQACACSFLEGAPTCCRRSPAG